MMDQITLDFAEVEKLVDRATSARSKSMARPHIQRLEVLPIGKNVTLPASHVFSDLVCSVKAASGLVRDKEHKIAMVRNDLSKLKRLLDKF